MKTDKKTITMNDIASMCGVSVATVSYVLNGRDDQRIPEATKRKITQIANLYQYRLNPYAKALATGKLRTVLFFTEDTNFSLYKAEIYNFVAKLSSLLKKNTFNLIFAPVGVLSTYKYVDAILTYRISKNTFKALGELNYVPLISIDCEIEDELFFRITNDFSKYDKSNDILYLSFKYNDDAINQTIKQNLNVTFITSINDLENIKECNYSKLISFNKEIYKFLIERNIKCDLQDVDSLKKLEIIYKILQLAISKSDVDSHKYLI